MNPSIASDKLYFSIGEVKEITRVEPHVLRYWEVEFPTLRPKKSRTGLRTYTKKDIEVVLQIRRLLYQEKYTIKGAKTKMKGPSRPNKKDASPPKMPSSQVSSQTTPTSKAAQQLFFDSIQSSANAQLNDRDFLLSLQKKLKKISSSIRGEILEHDTSTF